MTMKKKDEITESEALTVTVNGGSAESEDWDLSEGFEMGEMTLTQIPTLKLTQALTPEVSSGEYDGLRPGMFINDMTKENLGTEIEFRLVGLWKQRIKFAPRDSGTNTIECSCPTVNKDANGDIGTTYGYCNKCHFLNFMAGQDHCSTQYVLVVAVNDDPHNLYRVILSKTSYKSGTEFLRAFKNQTSRFAKAKLPYFMFRGKLTSKKVKNPKMGATYFIYSLESIVEKEVPTMEKDLYDDFMLAAQEVQQMRISQKETAIEIAKANLAERQDEEDNSSEFKEMNSTLAADMDLSEEEVSEKVPEDKIPF